MKRDGGHGKAWRRDPDDEAAKAVVDELQKRELADLDTCRRVWEEENDPLAVCVAVTKSEDLPEWLRHAVLALLTEGEDEWPSLKAKLWRERRGHAVDMNRAIEVAMWRTHPRMPSSLPQTWEAATIIGERLAREQFHDAPAVSPAGAKKSYDNVRRGLPKRPGRYYRAPGFTEHLVKAWDYMEKLLVIQLDRLKPKE